LPRKKDRLDRFRPLSPEALRNLEHYYDVEITYTSNAIEGNTLTAVETTLVIEQGITITGRPLKDHLEALDHYDAIRYVRELASEKRSLIENDLRNLHRFTMQRSRPDIAGRYAELARYVRTETGRFEFPSPVEIPALMGDFAGWLGSAPATPEIAFEAHRRLVDIHPFQRRQRTHSAASHEPYSYPGWLSACGSAPRGPPYLYSSVAAIPGRARNREFRHSAL